MAFAIPAAIAAAFSGGAAGTAAVSTGIAGASTLAAATVPEITGISTALAGAGTAAASTPGWLATAGTVASAVGGVTGAVGAYESGQAGAKAAKYNAAVAASNAATAKANADIAGQAGAEQETQQSLKTRAEIGSLKANQAAAGLDVNSGSALDVRSSAQQLGELDALTVRSNATKAAYGYDVQSENFTGEANLDKSEASSDETAGDIGAGSTLLGSAGSAASNFAKYQLAGGFSG